MPISIEFSHDDFSLLVAAFKRYSKGNFLEAWKISNRFRQASSVLYASKKSKIVPVAAKYSVIVVYGGAQEVALKECIDSLGIKARADVELIVINNGMGKLDTKIFDGINNTTVVNIPCNIFPSEARNIAACFASGEWVYFIDDDAELSSGFESILDASHLAMHAVRGSVFPKNRNNKPPAH